MLHSDLIVAARPTPDDLPRSWSAEHLLLASGAPVLLVPDDWSGTAIGDRVVIAWNGSREARRAVNDAMPFLGGAAQVTILIVDAPRAHRSDDEPGADIVGHLRRHDIEAAVRVASPQASGVASTLRRKGPICW